MMMNKLEFLEEIEKVDVTKVDWADALINLLPRCYERGYLEAMLSNWNVEAMPMDESLKEELMDWCSYFRWES